MNETNMKIEELEMKLRLLRRYIKLLAEMTLNDDKEAIKELIEALRDH